MTVTEALEELRRRGRPDALAGMARYAIPVDNRYGVSAPDLRRIAREAGRDHELALRLWDAGIRDARMLAALVDVPARVTAEQMQAWAEDFDGWDICDGCCIHLFRKAPQAHHMIRRWTDHPAEFVRRAGFALIATLAVHDAKTDDAVFEGYLALIESAADDERNFVKKAVNWALRSIGKRSRRLNAPAVALSRRLATSAITPARWIGSDALRELTSAATVSRIRR